MQGETLIMLDLKQSNWNLNYDDRVKILSYLTKRLRDFTYLPPEVKIKVSPFGFLGSHSPSISLYTDKDVEINVNEMPDPDALEAQLNDYIKTTGKEELLRLAHGETLSWEDVLKSCNL